METTCVRCDATGVHDVIDPLIPDKEHVAYVCPECDIIYQGPAYSHRG